jgi:uncharacterized protein (TIGR01777 family)
MILVAGATGFLGRAVCARLARNGLDVALVTRGGAETARRIVPTATRVIRCDLTRETLPDAELDGVTGVVNLCGETISQLWTRRAWERIRRSRIDVTRRLVETLIRRPKPPAFLINASGIGCYGNRGDDIVDETAPLGAAGLAGVCREWEKATEEAAAVGVRVVILRLGVVMGVGGFLQRMVPAFQLVGGAILGDGRHWLSWIHEADLMSVFVRAITDSTICGPLNAASPHPVTNEHFTRALTSALRRRVVARVPRLLLESFAGGLAREVLFGSQRAVPRVLTESGFRFAYGRIEDALARVLAESRSRPSSSWLFP